MLVLHRKFGEEICIGPGTVQVVERSGQRAALAFTGFEGHTVDRLHIWKAKCESGGWNRGSAGTLVLGVEAGEEIRIDMNVRIIVIKVTGHAIKVGVEAPQDVKVLRAELMIA